ncbi:protein NYNRIN-like, partial [Aphis craccivora]
GHAGISRTVKRLKLNHNWRNIKKYIKRYIKNCELCQKNKSHNKTKQPISKTFRTYLSRYCRTITKNYNGKHVQCTLYILTLQDELSRYALAIALSSTDAPTESITTTM